MLLLWSSWSLPCLAETGLGKSGRIETGGKLLHNGRWMHVCLRDKTSCFQCRSCVGFPLMLSGVYMPTTGNGAAGIIRQGIYQHLKQTLADSPLHAHIVAGDMNAALYKTDRQEGRRGQHDGEYQKFIQETGLLPFDHQQAGAGRAKMSGGSTPDRLPIELPVF